MYHYHTIYHFIYLPRKLTIPLQIITYLLHITTISFLLMHFITLFTSSLLYYSLTTNTITIIYHHFILLFDDYITILLLFHLLFYYALLLQYYFIIVLHGLNLFTNAYALSLLTITHFITYYDYYAFFNYFITIYIHSHY
jgi:hypothetical protein